jgi:hypothetical protein
MGYRKIVPRPLLALAALLVGAPACLFPSSSSSRDGGTQSGFTGPTLLVTAGGARVGPVAAAAGSYADVVDEKNPLTGRVTASRLTIYGVATNAACQIYAERLGDGVYPFFATGYTLEAQVTANTADGAASPGAGERIVVGNASWRCVGSGCDGGQLTLRALDAAHVEGFISGTYESEQVAGYLDSVTCSFWLPIRTYQR